MKCPYRNFEECIIEKCPSCNYKVIENKVIEGRYPLYMTKEEAVNRGYAWECIKTTYEFISCKLTDNNVQPIPERKQIINNTAITSVRIKKSIF